MNTSIFSINIYKHKASSFSQGFTLIELLITLTVAAILATIAVPSFNGVMERIRTTRATESMAAALYNAKSEAIKRNAFVRVVFTTSNSGATWCYGLTTATTCNCTTPDSCLLAPEGVEKVVSNTQFKGIAAAVTPADSTFSFNPLRGTVNAGNVQFTSNGQGLVARAVVSGKGRVTTCSDSGVGGFKTC